MPSPLYEFKHGGVVKYGISLTKNSQGHHVIEVKGSGEILTIDPKDVTEVLPYTIGVKFRTDGEVFHYFAEKGSVKKGDFVLMQNPTTYGGATATVIVHVVGINTKSKKANKYLKGLVLTGTKLLSPNEPSLSDD